MKRGAKRSLLPIICHTYPAMMKLGTVIPYLKKIQKIYESRDITDISIFSPEISKFCSIKKYRYRLHFGTQFRISLTFIASLRIFLIKLVIILIKSAKMATPGLLKITIF